MLCLIVTQPHAVECNNEAQLLIVALHALLGGDTVPGMCYSSLKPAVLVLHAMLGCDTAP